MHRAGAHESSNHSFEEIAARAAARGHRTEGVIEFFDNDDSSGYVRCSCGYRSGNAKVCWLRDIEDGHLRTAAR